MFPARVVGPATRLAALFVLIPGMSLAQAPAQPPGPYVIDVRGTTLGVPQTSPFYPDIPPETFVPARGYGLQAGVHVYPFGFRSRRVGVGVDLFLTRATATTPTAPEPDSSTPSPDVTSFLPDVEVTVRSLSPQLSINFGSARGWSYLTTGVGMARVASTAGSASRTTSTASFNAGAGARWFVSRHIGVGFDLRALWVGSRALFGASAGLSFK